MLNICESKREREREREKSVQHEMIQKWLVGTSQFMAIVRDMSYSMARVMRPFTDYPIIEKRLLQIAIAEQFTIHLHKTCDDSHQHAAHTHTY